jgi:hypothetical protein
MWTSSFLGRGWPRIDPRLVTGVKNGKAEGDPRGDVSEPEAAT